QTGVFNTWHPAQRPASPSMVRRELLWRAAGIHSSEGWTATAALMRPNDLPVGGHSMGDVVPIAGPDRAVHIPDGRISGLRVLPEEVGFAIAIEVGCAYHLPGRGNVSFQVVPGSGPGRSVHVP